MINGSDSGNTPAAVPSNELSVGSEPSSSAATPFVDFFESYSEYVWRSVRRFGVREGDADDAAQQVLMVAARKYDSITPGSERAFLTQTALRVAATLRRTYARRREDARELSLEAYDLADRGPASDELLNMRQAREQLDAILDEIPFDLRAVFVLHELEEETMADIASTLGIPKGTVASRLRRARTLFYESVARTTLPGRSAE
jgi:RNA polymerase sigma-70 factor (ECF subfamily)